MTYKSRKFKKLTKNYKINSKNKRNKIQSKRKKTKRLSRKKNMRGGADQSKEISLVNNVNLDSVLAFMDVKNKKFNITPADRPPLFKNENFGKKRKGAQRPPHYTEYKIPEFYINRYEKEGKLYTLFELHVYKHSRKNYRIKTLNPQSSSHGWKSNLYFKIFLTCEDDPTAEEPIPATTDDSVEVNEYATPIIQQLNHRYRIINTSIQFPESSHNNTPEEAEKAGGILMDEFENLFNVTEHTISTDTEKFFIKRSGKQITNTFSRYPQVFANYEIYKEQKNINTRK